MDRKQSEKVVTLVSEPSEFGGREDKREWLLYTKWHSIIPVFTIDTCINYV